MSRAERIAKELDEYLSSLPETEKIEFLMRAGFEICIDQTGDDDSK